MSMAAKYAMKRRMASGGAVMCAHGMGPDCPKCYADGGGVNLDPGKVDKFTKGFNGVFSEGGFVEEEKASGYDEALVERLMEARAMSEGGMIANDTPPMADEEPADYDDLAMRDELEQHYTGENSGDEIGNAQQEEDERDMVDRIMRSRAKNDRMPRPA